MKETKNIILFGLAVLIVVFLFVVNISGQETGQSTIYCAEKTLTGASCQNVPLEEVNTGTNPLTDQPYKYDRTSCESTSYCKIGTCVNTKNGECLPSPQATCNPAEGGNFYDKESADITACQVGCCILGDGASLVERAKCTFQGKDYNVKPLFKDTVKDEISCAALASPETKGACIFETEEGKDCKHLTKAECPDPQENFHEGFLCSAEELGTICTRTQRTQCVSGKKEVYFVDLCGNIANVYNAKKINDIAYWSYVPGVQGVEVDFGDGKGNINSRTNGACNYLEGSTCASGDAQYGNYVCKDLRCPASDPLSGGKLRQQGEAWCSEPIEKFENAKPGQISYLSYCYNGEIQYEPCDYYRNELCLGNQTTGAAQCVMNNWIDCTSQNNEEDCLNDDLRDCKILEGTAGAVQTSYAASTGNKKTFPVNGGTGSCVPKYTPGFKFWDTKGTITEVATEEAQTPLSLCGFSNVICYVHYTEGFAYVSGFSQDDTNQECIDACKNAEGWNDEQCTRECTPICFESELSDKDSKADINADWAQNWQNMCLSLGDCGVVENYLKKEGYNKWRDLYIAGDNVNLNKIPNLYSKK
ncbi:MAG: hypothetical protein AABY15_03635 [Nanoarchaeota archaeon]